jgi:hypothetical protein
MPADPFGVVHQIPEALPIAAANACDRSPAVQQGQCEKIDRDRHIIEDGCLTLGAQRTPRLIQCTEKCETLRGSRPPWASIATV